MRTRTRVFACLSLCASCAAALATEGGGNSYPIGVETQMTGYMAPEGNHFFVYYQHYDADRMKNNAGDDSPALAHFRLKADVLALRWSHVWRGVRLFGATIETRLVQPVAAVDLSLGIARPAPLAPLDRGGHDTGLADTAFVPLILGWHGLKLHQTVGLDTHLPLGDYDAARRVNTGRNYYQAAPFYAFTWFFAPGWEASGKLRYAINSRNNATHYRSGHEATFEYSMGYRFGPALSVGANGYVYRQVTDDDIDGVSVNGNGNRGSVQALGPYVQFNATPALAILVKLQQEWGARNRPEGTRAWVQARIPF
jgi:hypothetical protein